MKTLEALANAAAFIASRRQAAHLKGSEEEEKAWLYLRALTHFIRATGQIYQLEDSLKLATPSECPHVSAQLGAHRGTFAQLAARQLLKTLNETAEPQQKQHALLLIALINFIVDTGQSDAAEDFFTHQLEYAPLAIAHFTSPPAMRKRKLGCEASRNLRAQPTSSLAMSIINSGIGVRTILVACIETIPSNRNWRH